MRKIFLVFAMALMSGGLMAQMTPAKPISGVTASAKGEGVILETGRLGEAVAKAKAQNKHVLLIASATW